MSWHTQAQSSGNLLIMDGERVVGSMVFGTSRWRVEVLWSGPQGDITGEFVQYAAALAFVQGIEEAFTRGSTVSPQQYSPEQDSASAGLQSQSGINRSLSEGTPREGALISDTELAGWARNWHWNDCAEDKPVDPSIYFRDMRMLKAFVEHVSTVSRADRDP